MKNRQHHLPKPEINALPSTFTGQSLRQHARAFLSSSLLVGCLAFGSSAHAGLLKFEFTYSNDLGAPETTAAQQEAIEKAGVLFSTMFATHFSNGATLQFNVVSQTSGVAAASSDAVLRTNSRSVEVVQTKIQTGDDTNGGAADGSIEINWSNSFVLNPNAPVNFGAGELDLFSVLAHEFTHALGFASFAGLSSGTFRNKFDEFLTTLSGDPLIDGTTGLVDPTDYADAAFNNAFFIGANAVAANGGQGVSIQGRSGGTGQNGFLSHLGTDAFSAPSGGSPSDNALMLCCGGVNVTGQGRDYNAVEVGILTDLGYARVSAVPEPATYAVVLAGLALLGLSKKRAKKKS